jgi:BlaI family transcriptional regulator, penicillinase repressor
VYSGPTGSVMPRKRSPALTDAEARVMAALWQLERATVGDLVSTLNKKRTTTYSTVQTILRILETKGYVSHEKVARAFLYQPLVDERQARRRAWKHLAARLFNGSPSLLVLNVLEDETLDPDEIKHLKKLIEQA